jgi:hypothetical protein
VSDGCRLDALRSRIALIGQEYQERRSLREQRLVEAEAKAVSRREARAQTVREQVRDLQEAQRRKEHNGGWETAGAQRTDETDDGNFGFEEDEDEALRRAGYSTADTASIPHPAPAAPPRTPPQTTPPVRSEPPQPGRHRRPAPDDDDFENTDWVTG